MKVIESQLKEGSMIIPKCPGCGMIHILPTQGEGTKWGYNGNANKPTFTPSLLCRTGKYVPGISKESYDYYNETEDEWPSVICHSFITDGRIDFLSDCTHALAGKTVELPEVDLESSFYKNWEKGNY